MLIRFWGSRGSIPTPLGYRAIRSKMHDALMAARGHQLDSPEAIDSFIAKELPFSVGGTYGVIRAASKSKPVGDEYVLCDVGSGVREFGNALIAKHGPAKKSRFNVFLSHTHWDPHHGFPFFTPSYIPGNVIRIHGCHKGCATFSFVSSRILASRSTFDRSAPPSNSSSWNRGARTRSTACR